MKIACLVAALFVIATSTCVMALPVAVEGPASTQEVAPAAPDCQTTTSPAPQTPFEKCVAEHGGQYFPYPGTGECHTLGHCECQPNGGIACVC